MSPIRNIGPVTRQMLGDVEIHGLEDLREIGAVAAFVRLRFRFGQRVSLNALYALEAGLRNIDWRQLPPEVKAGLRDAAMARVARLENGLAATDDVTR